MTWHRGPSRSNTRRDSVRDTAANRLRRVGSGEVMTWAEQAIHGFYRDMDAFRMHKDPAALAELRKAVSMLAGAMDVLEERNTD